MLKNAIYTAIILSFSIPLTSIADTVYRTKIEFTYKETLSSVSAGTNSTRGTVSGYAVLQIDNAAEAEGYNKGILSTGSIITTENFHDWELIDAKITVNDTDYSQGVYTDLDKMRFFIVPPQSMNGSSATLKHGSPVTLTPVDQYNSAYFEFSVSYSDVLFSNSEFFTLGTTNNTFCTYSGIYCLESEDPTKFDKLVLESVVFSPTYSVEEVPVPVAAWLFGSALLGLASLRK